LVSIAQTVFLLEHGQTDATECPTHAGGYAGLGRVLYGIVGFNVPFDTLQIISETILQVR